MTLFHAVNIFSKLDYFPEAFDVLTEVVFNLVVVSPVLKVVLVVGFDVDVGGLVVGVGVEVAGLVDVFWVVVAGVVVVFGVVVAGVVVALGVAFGVVVSGFGVVVGFSVVFEALSRPSSPLKKWGWHSEIPKQTK